MSITQPTPPGSQPLPVARRRSGSIPGAIADLVDALRKANTDLNLSTRAMIIEHREMRTQLIAAVQRATIAEARIAALEAERPVLRRRKPRAA